MVSKLTLAAHKKQLQKLRANPYIHLLLSNSQGGEKNPTINHKRCEIALKEKNNT